ncbi:hypothetical protein FQR65_LT02669 [Abscondita terminalis]|nr:hypothetical protein FQR65_LT02669 [Abscondita terminalis]
MQAAAVSGGAHTSWSWHVGTDGPSSKALQVSQELRGLAIVFGPVVARIFRMQAAAVSGGAHTSWSWHVGTGCYYVCTAFRRWSGVTSSGGAPVLYDGGIVVVARGLDSHPPDDEVRSYLKFRVGLYKATGQTTSGKITPMYRPRPAYTLH